MRFSGLIALVCCANPVPVVDDGFVPNYQDHIAPMLDRACVRCHSHDGALRDGVELDTYASARSTRISSVCTSVTPEVIDLFAEFLVSDSSQAGGEACDDWAPFSMPPGAMVRLSPQDQLLYAQWVAAGAPEVAP